LFKDQFTTLFESNIEPSTIAKWLQNNIAFL